MPQSAQIADRLQAVFTGDAWHGPTLALLLNEMDAAAAAAHPWHGVHSVWEVTLHVTAWNKAVLRRMHGEKVELTHQQDWPPVAKFSDSQWQADIMALVESHSSLPGGANLSFGPLGRYGSGSNLRLRVYAARSCGSPHLSRRASGAAQKAALILSGRH